MTPSPHRAATAAALAWPTEFLWGSAGASYQIEGGNVASDLWLLERVKPTLFRAPAGDACDSYNRIDEDLALAASLGFNTHRLSLEWSRIEPERGEISQAGLAYYRRVLERCNALGMTPLVTYNHWTVPRWFAAGGGFETRDGIAPFVAFCRHVTEAMGDQIGLAATFNEANIRAQLSWVPALRAIMPVARAMEAAAAGQIGVERYSAPFLGDVAKQEPVMLEAHSRAFEAIKAVRPDLPVGFTVSLNDDQAGNDKAALERKISEVWRPWLQAEGDWIGVQTYTRSQVGPDGDLPPEADSELTGMGYEYCPEALGAVLRRVAAMTDRPLYVTESGLSTPVDQRRIDFIQRTVASLQSARGDGVDVRGYLHWSLLDNWEWIFGYAQHFGLIEVDRISFKRTPKPSAAFYSALVRRARAEA